jgi:hypothetical protein
VDCSTSCTTPPLPPSYLQFFLPSVFSQSILSHASLAMCRLIAICTSDTDCPSSYQLSHFCFVSDWCPHYLIITVPSCTLCVCFFSDVFLTRFMLRVPPMIHPPPWRSSIFDEMFLDLEMGVMLRLSSYLVFTRFAYASYLPYLYDWTVSTVYWTHFGLCRYLDT